jgi:glycosyltransferase involved in cell wall biosynthesis
MASVYAAADVGLVPLRGLPVFETVVPSKLFEVWAMARPVVLAARGESERLVRRSGAGVTVPPEDPAALATAVRRLMGDPALRAGMGQAGRALVEAEFDRARIAEQYAAILERARQAHPRGVLGRLRAVAAR